MIKLGDKVCITELQVIGVVKSIWSTVTGTQYQVRYFLNGKAEEIYFYDHEIELKAT